MKSNCFSISLNSRSRTSTYSLIQLSDEFLQTGFAVLTFFGINWLDISSFKRSLFLVFLRRWLGIHRWCTSSHSGSSLLWSYGMSLCCAWTRRCVSRPADIHRLKLRAKGNTLLCFPHGAQSFSSPGRETCTISSYERAYPQYLCKITINLEVIWLNSLRKQWFQQWILSVEASNFGQTRNKLVRCLKTETNKCLSKQSHFFGEKFV